jgi:hypothetical protein
MNRVVCAVSLVATLVACSKDLVAPRQVSVLYANHTTHINPADGPGTAVITWLSPETVGEQQHQGAPGGGNDWYGPGFRTDTVGPNQEICVHFEAPGNQIAVEYRISLPGATLIGYPGTASTSAGPGVIAWHFDPSWGFNGERVRPAGSSDDYGGIVQGC